MRDISVPTGSVRLAHAHEVSCLQSLEVDAAKRFRHVPGYSFVADLPPRDATEHARVQQNGAALVIDAAPEGLAGFVLLLPVDGRAHVLEAAVALAHQQRGIGRRLMSAAETWAVDQAFGELTLTTYRDVPWNRPLYEFLGYEVLEPGSDRRELQALIAEEVAAGFARLPRVAMRKALGLTR